MSQRLTPDCPRWRSEEAALPPHTSRKERNQRGKVHAWTCPKCTGWTLPANLPRDPDPGGRSPPPRRP